MIWRDGLFQSKRAVVTGAARGIGRSIAELLVRLEAEVYAVDLDAGGLAGLPGVHAVPGDITSEDFRAHLRDAVGRIDHLVNAAGVQLLVRADQATSEDWDRLFAVNAKAPFFLCRDLGARMRDGGRIVNFSSVAARSGETPETVIYAAAKTAVLSMTRSFAYSYSPRGICVNAILPGIFDTPMQDLVLDGISAMRDITRDELSVTRLGIVPLGRSAHPRECADAAAWLLSEGGAYVTGQGIAVDGGYTMA